MPKKQSKPCKILLLNTDYSASEERKKARLYGGVAYYRLLKPMMNLEGFETTFKSADMIDDAIGKRTEEFYNNLLKGYDIVVMKCVDNPEAASNFLFFAKKYGVKVVLDLDDNLFEVKPDQPAYKMYGKGGEKRPIVSALLSMVDALFVSTQPLADYYTKYLQDIYKKTTPTFVLPNYNDVKDFDFPISKNTTNKIVIGWIGSTTHNDDLKLTFPAIQRLMREYPNLEFNLVGGLTTENIPKVFEDFDDSVLDRVYTSGGTIGWEGFPKMLMELPWDIGLAPLTSHEFNRCKSHIKWMEIAMKHIPCVCSRVYPYHNQILGQDTVIDGKTGMLCDEKEWYYKLKKLIDNKELREQIGENSYKYVKKYLQYKDHLDLWKKALKEVSKLKPSKLN